MKKEEVAKINRRKKRRGREKEEERILPLQAWQEGGPVGGVYILGQTDGRSRHLYNNTKWL